jgi:O-antigen ligase
MKTSRTVPLALAGLAFAVALYLEMTYVMMFGFWDGFTSELNRAENVLARYFIWFSLAMGVWFIRLGFQSSHANFKQRVLYSCLLFVIAAGVAVSLDLYFRTYMMDSAGG